MLGWNSMACVCQTLGILSLGSGEDVVLTIPAHFHLSMSNVGRVKKKPQVWRMVKKSKVANGSGSGQALIKPNLSHDCGLNPDPIVKSGHHTQLLRSGAFNIQIAGPMGKFLLCVIVLVQKTLGSSPIFYSMHLGDQGAPTTSLFILLAIAKIHFSTIHLWVMRPIWLTLSYQWDTSSMGLTAGGTHLMHGLGPYHKPECGV